MGDSTGEVIPTHLQMCFCIKQQEVTDGREACLRTNDTELRIREAMNVNDILLGQCGETERLRAENLGKRSKVVTEKKRKNSKRCHAGRREVLKSANKLRHKE